MKKLLLISALLFSFNGWAQVSDEIHQRCKDAADYVGCVQISTGSVPTKENSNEVDLRKALKLLPRRLEYTSLRDFSSAIQPFTDALALAANDSSPSKYKLKLGILWEDVDKDIAERLGLEVEKGVLIREVFPNSAAEEAGLQVDDVIIGHHALEINNITNIFNIMKPIGVGEFLELTILRDNKKKYITALLKEIEATTSLDKSRLVYDSKRIEGALDVARVTWNNSIDADIKWMGIQNCRNLNQTVEAFNSWMGGMATYYPCTKESSKGIRLESVMLSIIGKSALLAAKDQPFSFPPFITAAQFNQEEISREIERKKNSKKIKQENKDKPKIRLGVVKKKVVRNAEILNDLDLLKNPIYRKEIRDNCEKITGSVIKPFGQSPFLPDANQRHRERLSWYYNSICIDNLATIFFIEEKYDVVEELIQKFFLIDLDGHEANYYRRINTLILPNIELQKKRWGEILLDIRMDDHEALSKYRDDYFPILTKDFKIIFQKL